MLRRISASLVLALGCGFAFWGSPVKGNTISVANGGANTLTGVYTYGVTLSSEADVGNGNGFVIYDFPDVTSATFAWSASSLATLAANSDSGTFSPQISLLYNYISAPSLGVSASAPSGPANELDTALNEIVGQTDNPSIDNLSMVYSGSTLLGSTLGSLSGTLTVTTSLMGSDVTTTQTGYVSLDNGGGTLAANVITVTSVTPLTGSMVPLPASFIGGGLLMALFGIGTMTKKSLWRTVRH